MLRIVYWSIICLCKACDRFQTCSFTIAKIKHREPETGLNTCLIYLLKLEQIRAELTDNQMDADGGDG